jgi:hypothetical protein
MDSHFGADSRTARLALGHPRGRGLPQMKDQMTEARERTKYRTIVADPPWQITMKMGAGGRRARATEVPYSMMSLEDIKALPVADRWPTMGAPVPLGDRRLFREGEAAAVARAWGFEPCGEFIWGLRNPGMGGFNGNGHEPILLASRGGLPFPKDELPAGRHVLAAALRSTARCTPRSPRGSSTSWSASARSRGWRCSPAVLASAGTTSATRASAPRRWSHDHAYRSEDLRGPRTAAGGQHGPTPAPPRTSLTSPAFTAPRRTPSSNARPRSSRRCSAS